MFDNVGSYSESEPYSFDCSFSEDVDNIEIYSDFGYDGCEDDD